jgi:hypothetical protein
MGLPFAALHQLCGPMLNRLGRLRGPLRDALGVAFGMSSGSVPGRLAAGGSWHQRRGRRPSRGRPAAHRGGGLRPIVDVPGTYVLDT